MPFMQVVVFLLRYGYPILKLVRSIWELVEWIRSRDEKVAVGAQMMRQNLHTLARTAKKTKDVSGLEIFRDTLAKRKSEIERGQV